MIYPALSDLIKKAGNRYSLVIATAKRARELVESDPNQTDEKSAKPVSVAIQEIHQDKIIINEIKRANKQADQEAEDMTFEDDSDA
ncbi:MAG: DNA-directed RNA polymerase subunit omega [Eubacteriales bacterium]|jgi:DNA-directed RNA polymerase subunit omega|nr:DNA-directed RNA polymerase subunit omega [Eubacteriales bacterium]